MSETTAGIGEAISEGTHATPYHGTPVTTGLKLGMENELRRQQIEARKEAQDAKKLALMSQYKTFKTPKVHPGLHKYVSNFGDKWFNDMTLAQGNTYETNAKRQEGENFIAETNAVDAIFQNNLQKANNPTLITNPKIKKALNASNSDEYDKAVNEFSNSDYILEGGNAEIEKNSKYGNVVKIYASPQKKDVTFLVDKGVSDLISSSDPKYIGEQNGEKKFKYAPSIAEINQKIDGDLFNEEIVDNILHDKNNYPSAIKQIDEAVSVNPNIRNDPDQIQQLRKEIAKGFLKKIYDKQVRSKTILKSEIPEKEDKNKYKGSNGSYTNQYFTITAGPVGINKTITGVAGQYGPGTGKEGEDIITSIHLSKDAPAIQVNPKSPSDNPAFNYQDKNGDPVTVKIEIPAYYDEKEKQWKTLGIGRKQVRYNGNETRYVDFKYDEPTDFEVLKNKFNATDEDVREWKRQAVLRSKNAKVRVSGKEYKGSQSTKKAIPGF